ncbi:tetratricopeptide repeat protein [Candidatus Sumerlaeota bacterium]|nr:tetratricopeptide repeat protein [Candidatus Sumerlaeota bacterium]MBI3736890.1 tetratricopeptide repeat protein [Candidatus Sumerlaeota bacterium]
MGKVRINERKEAMETQRRERPKRKTRPGEINLNDLTIAALILAATFIAYIPAIRAGFVWDDGTFAESPLMTSFQGLKTIWLSPSALEHEHHYWPLVYTAFWVEFRFWGMKAAGYHAINILFHAANSLLLGWILRRQRIPGAWLAAAIFALHPVHVESVAWVIERKDVMSGFFYLLAFAAYAGFDERRSYAAYAGALVCLVCAMLCKSVAMSFPLILVLWLWWKGERLGPKKLAPILPFLLISLVMVGFDLRFHATRVDTANTFGAAQRVLIAARALWFYGLKSFWPAQLMAIYPQWDISLGNATQYIFLPLSAFVPVILFARQKSWGRGLFFGIAFFGITIAPTLGLIYFGFMDYSFVADRFQYLAGAGLIIPAAALMEQIRGRTAGRGAAIGWAGYAALSLILGTLTSKQSALYDNLETLFTDTVKKNPNAWIGYYQIGFYRNLKEELDAAYDYFEQAVAVRPRYPDALNSMGVIRLNQGRLAEARKLFERALEIKPKYADPYNNLGLILFQENKPQEAIEAFQKAVAIKPIYADALCNIGVAYFRLARAEEGMPYFYRTLALEPRHPEANLSVGTYLMNHGQLDDAMRYFQRALQTRPNYPEALNNLGVALMNKGKLEEAGACFQKALQLRPNFQDAINNMTALRQMAARK